jgi:hypothetical protein
MAKFLVKNVTERSLTVVIEPWVFEELAPEAQIDIECSDDPGEIEFLVSDSTLTLYIDSERIQWSMDGKRKSLENVDGQWWMEVPDET